MRHEYNQNIQLEHGYLRGSSLHFLTKSAILNSYSVTPPYSVYLNMPVNQDVSELIFLLWLSDLSE